MYSTCLFCARPLGRNEVLEHFPIGRRLAYDPAKGRLWVVCAKCERWNLTPLETRWEAIEDAERLYRGATLRVSTDNIGLAQLAEGLELVRLGAPPRTELTAWRYGDQFGRRWRRHVALGASGASIMAAQSVLPWLGMATIGVAVGVVSAAYSTAGVLRLRSDAKKVRMFVRDENDDVLFLTNLNARCAALVPLHNGDWRLTLPFLRLRQRGSMRNSGDAVLTGAPALRALATMLPHLNRGGGSARRVREATEVLGATPNIDHLLRVASVNTEAKKTHYKIKDGESNVGALPPRLRLALEMALHEDDERRAMEGELRELEQRWRDAEEIAAIADALTIPAGLDERVTALRQRDPE